MTASSQHLRGDSPWRGPREKADDLMKSVIESVTSVGDIVLDWNASTGENLVHAYLSYHQSFSTSVSINACWFLYYVL